MTHKKPPHLVALEGNPGKRRVAARGVQPTGEATPPGHLTGYARVVWARVVDAMPAGTYRPTDTELLAAYCDAAATHREATAHVAAEGPVLTGPRGRQQRNPWFAVQRDAARQIESLGRRLGLDPLARERLSPPPQPTASKFAGLITTTTEDHRNEAD